VDIARPDEPFAVFVAGEASKGEFFPYLLQQRRIEAKEIGECPVRDSSVALEPRYHLWEEGIETVLCISSTPWRLAGG